MYTYSVSISLSLHMLFIVMIYRIRNFFNNQSVIHVVGTRMSVPLYII